MCVTEGGRREKRCCFFLHKSFLSKSKLNPIKYIMMFQTFRLIYVFSYEIFSLVIARRWN